MADPARELETVDAAVRVRQLHKTYRVSVVNSAAKRNVLNGIDLTVPKGQIYGLLGPSGCGKTSLLRCILGRLKPDRGSVLVFGHIPGTKESGIPGPQVGYTPQSITLYVLMTIGEILRYYGAIYGLPDSEIHERTRNLVELLRLPSKDMAIHRLSGGEIRRVSFATALLHHPRLLILDEPTVGVDPITKQAMWDYLLNLAKHEGTSVILTTHYIEEARQADMVGMIHRGKMVAEDSTAALLQKYNEATLEDVFLKLCCLHYPDTKDSQIEADPTMDTTSMVVNGTDSENNRVGDIMVAEDQAKPPKRKWCCGGAPTGGWTPRLKHALKDWSIDRTRAIAILVRIIINLYRFPGLILLILMVPMSQVWLFTQMVGSPIRDIHLGVVNEDSGEISQRFLAHLDPEVIVQKSVANLSDGLTSTREGEVYGYIHIRRNFSSVVLNRYTNMSLSRKEAVDSSKIGLYIDNTNVLIMTHTEYHLQESYQQFIWELLRDAGSNPALVDHPLNVSWDALQTLMQPGSIYLMGGEMVLASYFAAIPVTVISIFMERFNGHNEINRVMGVTSAEMVLGLILVQLVILVVQNVVIIVTALPVLHSRKGSLFLIYCLLYAVGLNGTVLGMFISLLSDNIISVVGVVSGYLFLSPAFSGMFWPLEAFPMVLQYLCWLSPLGWPVRAIDLVIHRGWGLDHFEVVCGLVVSLIWFLLHTLLSLVLLHVKQ